MKQRNTPRYAWLYLLLVLVLVNVAASFVQLRIDLTREKRFSLGNASRSLLQQLQEPITVDILLTGDFPAVFKRLQQSTEELLAEMKAYAGPNLIVRFIKAEEFIPVNQQDILFQQFTDSLRSLSANVDSLLRTNPGFRTEALQQLVADSLKTLGVLPYTLQVQQKENASSQRLIFPAALVRKGSRIRAVDLLSGKTEYSRDPLSGRLQLDEARSIGNAEALLEFKFADAIEKIGRAQKPLIGYLVGNGQPVGPETYDLVQALDADYELSIIDPNKFPGLPADFDAILVVKPTQPFNDSAKMKIDQYIMQGGKVLWFLDMLYAEKDSLAFTAQTLAFDRGLNLDDLLFRYGVRINRDLLQDQVCDLSKLVVGTAGGKPQLADVPFNYYPLLNPSQQHPVTKNLEPVLAQFVNTIDTVKASGVTKTILLGSSENAKVVSTPAIVSLEQLKTIERTDLYNRSNLAAAVMLEGSFTSLYANRASAAMRSYFQDFYGSFQTSGPPTGIQLVAGDGDLVLNAYTPRETFPMGYSRSQERSFANRAFLENSLQYMTGNAPIVALRNKDVTVRLLNKARIEEQRLYWQLANIGMPLLLLLLGGLAVGAWRRRAYRKA